MATIMDVFIIFLTGWLCGSIFCGIVNVLAAKGRKMEKS